MRAQRNSAQLPLASLDRDEMVGFFTPSLGAVQGAFQTPSFGGFSSLTRVGVLDDAKSKAQQLEKEAKNAADSASDKAKSAYNDAQSELSKAAGYAKNAAAGAPEPSGKIPLYSTQYYYTCAIGGIVACGTTHALVTPLDLVKCRRQVDKNLYKGNMDGWSKIWAENGLRGLYTGVGPTLIGYSMQGACKYGFYEYFKKTYSDMAGVENAKKYKDAIYLAGSASAEFIADVALVPMEAVKVRIQTTIPPFAKGVVDGTQKIIAAEGTGALYKSLPSLWSRQIPYTMMKFWSFEATVTQIYKYLGKPKSSYNKLEQLGVSFLGGYIAGVFCAVVSHPADTMVSKLNAAGKTGVAKPTVGSIYKEIGFNGLWAGLGTRIGTWSFVRAFAKVLIRLLSYSHDWHAHCTAMAHLRLGQDLLGSAYHRCCRGAPEEVGKSQSSVLADWARSHNAISRATALQAGLAASFPCKGSAALFEKPDASLVRHRGANMSRPVQSSAGLLTRRRRLPRRSGDAVASAAQPSSPTASEPVAASAKSSPKPATVSLASKDAQPLASTSTVDQPKAVEVVKKAPSFRSRTPRLNIPYVNPPVVSRSTVLLDSIFALHRPLLELPVPVTNRKTTRHLPVAQLEAADEATTSKNHLSPLLRSTVESFEEEETSDELAVASEEHEEMADYSPAEADSQALKRKRLRKELEARILGEPDGLDDRVADQVIRILADRVPFSPPSAPEPQTIHRPISPPLRMQKPATRQREAALAYLKPFSGRDQSAASNSKGKVSTDFNAMTSSIAAGQFLHEALISSEWKGKLEWSKILDDMQAAVPGDKKASPSQSQKLSRVVQQIMNTAPPLARSASSSFRRMPRPSHLINGGQVVKNRETPSAGTATAYIANDAAQVNEMVAKLRKQGFVVVEQSSIEGADSVIKAIVNRLRKVIKKATGADLPDQRGVTMISMEQPLSKRSFEADFFKRNDLERSDFLASLGGTEITVGTLDADGMPATIFEPLGPRSSVGRGRRIGMDSVKRKRKKKISKHKYKKRRKLQRAERKRLGK
ncbi:hypothetical protein E5Q_03229 [Mixia osmundae IAM 14324]|uniref:Ribosomal protein mS38 C-terminal domain-containing protein n=1 Tax=Mixia osmundae (strain CBS 9802 / IAM 14324 / JCM 22182 / KY 12970) TaxID=764103 RepID=G7E149_MIXOS|nr:hypothetical protein E5Q_03229 [Mixia osmundae IAM 14324]